MQFLPAFITSKLPDTASKTVSAAKKALTSKNMSEVFGFSGQNFATLLGDKMNNLKEFNPDNNLGIAPGFKSIKDDTGILKTRDLNFFEGKLREKGVDEDVLQNFMSTLFVNPELPTVGKMMGAAHKQLREGAVLDEQEKIAFSGLMQRIGFNTDEISRLEDYAAEGKGLGIIRSLEKQMKALDKNIQNNLAAELTGKADQPNALQNLTGLMHVTKEEAAALLKTLNLTPQTSANIMAQFGEDTELKMNPQGFNKLFAQAAPELQKEAAQMSKIRELTPELIRDMLQNAKITKASEPVADNRISSKAAHSETLIRETAMLLDEDDDNDKTPNLRKQTVLADILDKASKPLKAEHSADENAFAREQARGQNTALTKELGRELGKEQDKELGKEQNKDAGSSRHFSDSLKQDADRALRVENRPVTENSEAVKDTLLSRLDSNGSGGAFFSQSMNEANSAQSQQQVKASLYQERIYDQIEQGILKNSSQGSHQIIMRLDPPDLGRLTLSLTVANGEVRALIRTEQTEVTQVVSEQLAQLKASLEEQGFKVASLDVETKLQDRSGQDRSGMENPDSSNQQELKEERQAQAEFLRLARLRDREEKELAWSMQNTNQTAINAETGLHLVA